MSSSALADLSFLGSTGVPKGVDVKHGTMTNALLLEPGRLQIAAGSKIAQVLSISFAMGTLTDYPSRPQC